MNVQSPERRQSAFGVSASQSAKGVQNPRPFFASSQSATFTASFGCFSFLGRNLILSPHGVVQSTPSLSHTAEDSSCGERHAKPKSPVLSEKDSYISSIG